MPIGKSKVFFSLLAALLMSLNGVALASGTGSNEKIQAEVQKYTSNLPFKMPEIKVPEFPNRTFDIKAYGAVGNGQTLNTVAFKKAIQACSTAGGGTVEVPPGLWLTGPIELQSNVNFHVGRGAVILFTTNHKDYPIIKSPTRGFVVASPVYGFNLHNVAITGTGVFDGSGVTWRPVKRFKVTRRMWRELTMSGGVVTDGGKMWWPTKEAANGRRYLRKLMETKKKSQLTASDLLPARDFMRPILLFLSKCKNVLIDGVTLANSPMFAMYPDRCEDLVIRDVKINNPFWAQNGDGIDIGSSRNVLIYKCTVSAGDDGICMKSNRDKAHKTALKNVVIEDCVVYHAHGGFVIGSNTDGGVENVAVKDCDYIGTNIGLRFKSARGRGGLVKNIYVNNVYMRGILHQAILFNTYYEESQKVEAPQPVTATTPIFEDFYIDNIYCNGAREAVRVAGLPEMPIKNIRLSNILISADRGFSSEFASGFTLKNVRIIPKMGDVYSLADTKDFVIDNGFCPSNTNVFMSLKGKETNGIKITDTDLSAAKTPVEYGPNVDRNAVIRK